MNLTHKIRLEPNREQEVYFRKACGVARFAFNWGLAQWQEMHKVCQEDPSAEKPNYFNLKKRLNALKKENFPWMYEVTKCAPEYAIENLEKAYKNFFRRCKEKAKRKGFPKFKNKHKSKMAFSVTNVDCKVDGDKFYLPKLGWVRMSEHLRFQGKLMKATVSSEGGHWFVSVSMETTVVPIMRESQAVVGVDLGVSNLATLSTGEVIPGNKSLKTREKRLRRLSRRLSKKVKGSNNRAKAKQRLAKEHYRIRCARQDELHKLTTRLTGEFSHIVIEDLNVSGMMKNRHLAKAISDMGFFEFRRQLEYKAAMYGSTVVVADRFFPSSKTCSGCGHVYGDLTLGQRTWTCGGCGSTHDRDVNAATNLKNLVAA
jgi:putative transposase